MEEKHLHIISFDIPYPANYGGIIDVYHRIRLLAEYGVKIHLHCFEYGRKHSPQLEAMCHSVNYYPRRTTVPNLLRQTPYIVCSRHSKILVENLLHDNYPILVEGLHCTDILNDPRFESRNTIVRIHNIEHQYYRLLSEQEHQPLRRLYLRTEAAKLERYEKILAKARHLITVNKSENEYLDKKFGNATLIPSFHEFDQVSSLQGRGHHILYHANLSVPENQEAAKWLTNNVFRKTDLPVKIAGLRPPESLKKLIARHKNMQLIENPSDGEMVELIQNAHIIVMYTRQPTGLKLKLLHSLFSGRFCLVNSNMVAGTELGQVCHIADTPNDFLTKIKQLATANFDEFEIERRNMILNNQYSNYTNRNRLLRLIYNGQCTMNNV
ncbi:MAG: glycosyltransferase family 1 protein [Bacteroidales bacterium]|nr:glycosyltransferase family 1 protein [Bacteroidales bacterium]